MSVVIARIGTSLPSRGRSGAPAIGGAASGVAERKLDPVDRAALGADQQDAIDRERDRVFEQLAAGRGGGELGSLVAGLDLGDQELAIGLDQVVGAQLGLVGLAIDQRD